VARGCRRPWQPEWDVVGIRQRFGKVWLGRDESLAPVFGVQAEGGNSPVGKFRCSCRPLLPRTGKLKEAGVRSQPVGQLDETGEQMAKRGFVRQVLTVRLEGQRIKAVKPQSAMAFNTAAGSYAPAWVFQQIKLLPGCPLSVARGG
jgi:hypothetical protein